jgi:NADH-quinone oxidoreductase subunit N
LVWLTVLGLINSAIAAFYYLRVIVAIYMHEPCEATSEIAAPATGLNIAIWASAIGVLILGIFPSALLQFASVSAAAFR